VYKLPVPYVSFYDVECDCRARDRVAGHGSVSANVQSVRGRGFVHGKRAASPNARTERRAECGAGAAALSSCRDACRSFAPVTCSANQRWLHEGLNGMNFGNDSPKLARRSNLYLFKRE
jgi:hypothetical protein